MFAAIVAARQGVLVPAGQAAAFLAPLDVRELIRPEVPGWGDRTALADLLRRLGLRTLGAFAALPATDVAARFPADGVLAHRQARGLTDTPVAGRRPAADLAVEVEPDPPIERVDTATFVAKSLADSFSELLSRHGLACTRLRIEAVTEHGEQHARVWRHEGALSATAVAERARWQLDGWLSGRSAARPTAGVSLLRLCAEETVPHGGLQEGLWGSWGDGEQRAHRALTRLQGLLGPDAVQAPVLGGGRHPGEQGQWASWQEESGTVLPAGPPWPGRLAGPYPVSLATEPVDVLGPAGEPVGVSARNVVSAEPRAVRISGRSYPVAAWAGPWPTDERWWDPAAARRRARFQVVLDDEAGGQGFLLAVENGRWWLEGSYE
jgi:protein ImuB